MKRKIAQLRGVVPKERTRIEEIPEPRYSLMQQAKEYFHSKRDENGLIHWSALRPVEINEYLEFCFILKRQADTAYSCTFFSEKSVSVFQTDWTNKTIDLDGPYKDWVPRYNEILDSNTEKFYWNIFDFPGYESLGVEGGLFPIVRSSDQPNTIFYTYELIDVDHDSM